MRALIFVCAVCGALFLIGPATAAGALDQSQPVFGFSTSIGDLALGVTSHAQTFTAGMTGNLDQIDVMIERGLSPGNVLVEIRTAPNGHPSSTVLAHTLLLGTDVPLISIEPQWVSVPLNLPTHVAAGSQYAIVLTANHGNFQLLDMTDFETRHDFYPGGQELFQRQDPLHGWVWAPLSPTRPSDMAFKTYVTPFH